MLHRILTVLSNVLMAAMLSVLVAAAVLLGQPSAFNPEILHLSICLAIAVVLIQFFQSYLAEHTIEFHLRDHRLVRGSIKRSRQAKKVRAIRALHSSVCPLMSYCGMLARMGAKSGVSASDRPQFEDDLLALRDAVERSVRASKLALRDADHLVGGASDDILAAIRWAERPVPIDDDKWTADSARYGLASDLLGPVLARLKSRLDLAESRPPTAAGEQNRLILRPCRDTYPPGVAVRVKVEGYGQLSSREVTVTIRGGIFGLSPKATGTLPEPEPEPELPAALILPVDMGRKKLDAGQEYTARAKCGGLSDEAVFVVDRVVPAMHADKTVCTMGDCIDITVDDPAACAGGAGGESAGDGKGQRLTVKSPHEQFNCRLVEAVDLPGTFCGRVRCVGVDAGGSARDAAPDAERCGAGCMSTYNIRCGPNQLIRFHYERGDEKAWTAVLVEEPDAADTTGPTSTAGGDGEGGGSGRGSAEPAPRSREWDQAGRTTPSYAIALKPVRDAARAAFGAAESALAASEAAELVDGAEGIAPTGSAIAVESAYHARSAARSSAEAAARASDLARRADTDGAAQAAADADRAHRVAAGAAARAAVASARKGVEGQ